MGRRIIDAFFDRENLGFMNDNFKDLFEKSDSIPDDFEGDMKKIAEEVANDLLKLNSTGNIFNEYEEDTTISSSSGASFPNVGTVASDFIRIFSNKTYTIGVKEVIDIKNCFVKVAYYDIDRTFIQMRDWINLASTKNEKVKMPSNAAYARLVVNSIHKDVTYFNIGDKPYFDEETSKPEEPENNKIKNLFTDYIEGSTISDTSGSLNPDTKQVVSEFIEVDQSQKYTVGVKSVLNIQRAFFKIGHYDKDNKIINVGNWTNLAVDKHLVVTFPANTKYVRIVLNIEHKNEFYFNVGEVPYFEIDDESNVIETLQKPMQPYPKKFMWEVLQEGTNIKPLDLSRDGRTIYGSNGAVVVQSIDEGKTWQNIGGPVNGLMIQAVRKLDDGQLLASTTRDTANGIKSKVFRSAGYDRNNPTQTTFSEVLVMNSDSSNFNNPWSLDHYFNITLASEYGGHDLNGARYVYLSLDYGKTWTTIFDQYAISQSVAGAPNYTPDAHVHTAHYDRYRERIWVCVGDQDNTAVYFSDDFGKTWKLIEGLTGKDTMQYTGITSYPEGVFFGSDRNPDGVYFWNEAEPKTIKPFYLTDRADYRTLVYALPFRRFAEKDETTYFTADRDGVVDGKMGPVIVGMRGTKGAKLLYDFTDDFSKFIYTDISACVGDTIEGNVLVSAKDKNTGRYRLLRTKAPIWE